MIPAFPGKPLFGPLSENRLHILNRESTRVQKHKVVVKKVGRFVGIYGKFPGR